MYPSTKQALRQVFREKRASLSSSDFRRLNDQLLAQVKTLTLDSCLTVHLFLPIEGHKEPDTYTIATWMRKQYPGIRLVLPKTEARSYRMTHILWEKGTMVEVNRWGIPEPVAGLVIQPDEIDVVFIPLLIFDEHGHRVGYGKGFYDRFLATCRPTTQMIGLSLFEAVTAIADVSDYDVAMDLCVTPTQVWSFTTKA